MPLPRCARPRWRVRHMSSPCSRPCHRGRGAPRSSRYTSPACRPARSGSGRTQRQLSQFLRMPTDGPPPHGRGTSKVENEAVARRARRFRRSSCRPPRTATQTESSPAANATPFLPTCSLEIVSPVWGSRFARVPSPWSTHSVPFASSRSTAFPSVRSTRTLPPSRPSSTSRSSVVATHRPSVSAAIATVPGSRVRDTTLFRTSLTSSCPWPTQRFEPSWTAR